MPRDRKKYELKGKVDLRKIPRGHQPHQSGSGVHKNWRKETRQQTKIALKDEGGRGDATIDILVYYRTVVRGSRLEILLLGLSHGEAAL